MFENQELTRLQLRKQTLLLESDLHRVKLQTEWERLREGAGWAGRIVSARRAAGPWLPFVATLGGVAMVFGIRQAPRVFVSLAKALAVIQPLLRIWRTFTAPSSETK